MFSTRQISFPAKVPSSLLGDFTSTPRMLGLYNSVLLKHDSSTYFLCLRWINWLAFTSWSDFITPGPPFCRAFLWLILLRSSPTCWFLIFWVGCLPCCCPCWIWRCCQGLNRVCTFNIRQEWRGKAQLYMRESMPSLFNAVRAHNQTW